MAGGRVTLRAATAGVHGLESATPMPGYGSAFGRGLILGAGAALLYAVARETMAPARQRSPADRLEADDADSQPTPDRQQRHPDQQLHTNREQHRIDWLHRRGDERLRQQAQADERGRMIDWDWATRVAVRTAGRTPTLHPGARAQLQAQYESLLREIEQPIAAYTGNDLSLNNTRVEVLDRAGWIRANMVNFRALLQPVEEFYAESVNQAGRQGSPAALQHGARLMLSSQVGVLVGYLARRVLGQYDIALLSGEPATAGGEPATTSGQPVPTGGRSPATDGGSATVGGRLYFVEPNLQHVEHTLGVPPDELRRWIALHEATHAHEFELHPWVRTYLNASLRQYLRLLIDDMRSRSDESTLLTIVNRFVGNIRHGHNVINALMTPQQRELMSRLQALMSLAEGYSNHVMNNVGRELLPNFDLLHERVEHRQRNRSRVEQVFLRITGLSLKMEQYRLGELFVDEVVKQRSIAFANRAWESLEALPSEAEIRDPQRWIGRMEAARIG
jgi:coenzyme F420 biosynthesis associated uncharacterized protein